MTYGSGGNDTEITFVLVGKEKRKYLRDVKVIPGELQHRQTDTQFIFAINNNQKINN